MKKNPRAHKPSTGRVLAARILKSAVTLDAVDIWRGSLLVCASNKPTPTLPYESPRAARRRMDPAAIARAIRIIRVLTPHRQQVIYRWTDLDGMMEDRAMRLAAKVARADAVVPHPAVLAIHSPFDHAANRRSRSHGYVAPTPMDPRVSLALAFKGSMTKGGMRA